MTNNTYRPTSPNPKKMSMRNNLSVRVQQCLKADAEMMAQWAHELGQPLVSAIQAWINAFASESKRLEMEDQGYCWDEFEKAWVCEARP